MYSSFTVYIHILGIWILDLIFFRTLETPIQGDAGGVEIIALLEVESLNFCSIFAEKSTSKILRSCICFPVFGLLSTLQNKAKINSTQKHIWVPGTKYDIPPGGLTLIMAPIIKPRFPNRGFSQDTYHVIGVIFFVLNFQLIMAGRFVVWKTRRREKTTDVVFFSFPKDPWDWYIYLHLVDFYGKCR